MIIAAETSPSDSLRVVSQLLETRDIDTVYRDLYLQCARRYFSRLLSYQEYQRLSGREISIDNLLRQTHQSLEQGNWRKVKELSDRVHVLREEVKNKHDLLKVATDLYESVAMPLNRFSPGFNSLLRLSERDLSRLRDRALENLSSLQREDEESQAFYSSRRAHFETLSLDSLGESSELSDPGHVRKEALRAVIYLGPRKFGSFTAWRYSDVLCRGRLTWKTAPRPGSLAAREPLAGL